MNKIAPIILAAALLAGCTSTKAAVTRAEFALESEIKNRDNAEAQRKLVIHHLDQNVSNEVARLKAVLVRQNAAARGVDSRIAQNYIDYYTALHNLQTLVSTEYEKLESLHQEQLTLGRGYRYLNTMADEELKVGQQTAQLAIAEAIKAGNELWRQYQAANPPKPVDQPTGGGGNGGGGGSNPDGTILDQWGNPIPDNTPYNP